VRKIFMPDYITFANSHMRIGLTVLVTAGVAIAAFAVLPGSAQAKSQTTVGFMPDLSPADSVPPVCATVGDLEEQDPVCVPTYVPALDNSGNEVGYVLSAQLLRPSNDPIPVVGPDLITIVGHHHPMIGYVPEGADPSTVDPLDFRVEEE
jgi:hypothetical protein